MDGSITSDSMLHRMRRERLDLLAFSCLVTLTLLQAYRVFVPYLVFEIDQSERAKLAQIAVTVFALAFLGTVLFRLLGGRQTLLLATVCLIVARLAMQFTEDAGYRWILGAGAIIAWSWIMTVILPQGGRPVALGIGFSFAIDLLLRAARGTLDLPWMPGPIEGLVTVGIAVGIAATAYWVAASQLLPATDSTVASCVRHVGIGSGLALWLVIAGNIGFASERAGASDAVAFGLLAIGALAALMVALAGWDRIPVRYERGCVAGLGLLGLLAIAVWNEDAARWLEAAVLPLFACLIALLTMRCAIAGSASSHHNRWRTGAALTIGLLLQTVFVFAYFARSGPLELLALPVAVLTLAGLAGSSASEATQPVRSVPQRAVAAVALASLLVLGWLLIDGSESRSTETNPSSLTVMTFNMQEGFSNENIWSLEATARTIEAYDPDIVVLQEITRGWLVMSSVDQVQWLADRLGMDYAYAGNSNDGLWGNAILSRLPIASTRSVTFSTTDNLRRGAVAIEVATESGNLLVIDTHLDNPKASTDVRLEQIDELIAFWDGPMPAIVAGDFNADPGSPEWNAMIAAGFSDAAGADASTTSEDNRRIDYIFVTPDLQVDAYAVPDVWTSDHRPVVVQLSLAP